MTLKNESAVAGIDILFTLAFFAFSVVVILGIGLPTVSPLWSQEHIQIKVIEKIPYHDGRYLVTTEWIKNECIEGKCSGMPRNATHREVFSVSDELILLKFDASDRYMSLEQGKSYQVTVCMYRFHYLSWYRNIVEIKEV